MNVLVTGANGYLGGWVVEHLRCAGHQVLGEDSHGNEILFPDREFWSCAVDAVVHLGWCARVGDTEAASQVDCVMRTVKLLRRTPGTAHFVFASSAAVYGDRGMPKVVEASPATPNCAYSRAKIDAENLINHTRERRTVFRFGSLCGLGFARTKVDLCVNAFAIAGHTGKAIRVWHPNSWKPLLHVKDAAELIAMAVGCGRTGLFNAASRSVPALYVANLVATMTGAPVEVLDDSPNGSKSVRLNCRRLMSEFPEWTPRTLQSAILEFRGYREVPEDSPRAWALQ